VRLTAALLFAIVLAACSVPPGPPQVVYVAASPLPPGELLPVEAQRLIDRATATADAAEARLAAVTGLLGKIWAHYVEHAYWCDVRNKLGKDCTCQMGELYQESKAAWDAAALAATGGE
jgi:hypothetical protein